MSKGWYGNRHRHSLASKGVRTVELPSWIVNSGVTFDISTLEGIEKAERFKEKAENRFDSVDVKIVGIDKIQISASDVARGFTRKELEYLVSLEKVANNNNIDMFVEKIDDSDKDVFRVTYNGNDVIFNLNQMGDEKEVKSFFRNIDKAESVVQDILGAKMDDIFYSSIYSRAERSLGKNAGRHLAYSYIVDRLQNKGVWVHS